MAVTILPTELIELICPIPPVVTVPWDSFLTPPYDQESTITAVDPDVGYTVFSAAAIVLLRARLIADVVPNAALLTDIDLTGKNWLTGEQDSLTRKSLMKDVAGYFDNESRYYDNAAGGSYSVVTANAITFATAVTAWVALLNALPATPDAAVEQLVTDPEDPATWIGSPYIIHSVWWKMFKRYCHLYAGASDTGFSDGMQTPTWDAQPTINDVRLNAMPIVMAEDGKLWLCCAEPARLGKMVAVCEISHWERTSLAFTRITSGVDRFVGVDYLFLTRSTSWLMRRQPTYLDRFGGIVWTAVNLAAYPDVPANRAAHDIFAPEGANVSVFYIYRADLQRLHRIGLERLQLPPNGHGVSPPGTVAVGSHASNDRRYRWTIDSNIKESWTGLYSGDGKTRTSTEKLLFSPARPTTEWFSPALPYTEGSDFPTPTSNDDWAFNQGAVLGFLGYSVNGKVAGCSYPWFAQGFAGTPYFPPDISAIELIRSRSVVPGHAGTDLIDIAPYRNGRFGGVYGMWPMRHMKKAELWTHDDSGQDSYTDTAIDLSASATGPIGLTTAIPYRTWEYWYGTGTPVATHSGIAFTQLNAAIPAPPFQAGTTPPNNTGFTFDSTRSYYTDQDVWRAYVNGTGSSQLTGFTFLSWVATSTYYDANPIIDEETYARRYDLRMTLKAMCLASNITNSSTTGVPSGSNQNGSRSLTFTNTDADGNVRPVPETPTDNAYWQIRNCRIQIGGHKNDDGVITGIAVTGKIEYVLIDMASMAETILSQKPFSLTLEPDKSATLINSVDDDYLGLIKPFTYATLPTSWAVYLRIADVDFDRSSLVVPAGSLATNSITINIFSQRLVSGNDTHLASAAGVLARPAAFATWFHSGYPAGLTGSAFAANSMTLSGTPTAAPGFYIGAFTATHPEGTSAGHLPIALISPNTSPTFSLDLSFLEVGRQVVGRVSSRSNNTNLTTGSGWLAADLFEASGLPPGLSIDGSTGIVTGTPLKEGTYTVTVRCDWLGRRYGNPGSGWSTFGKLFLTADFIVTVFPEAAVGIDLQLRAVYGRNQLVYVGQPFSVAPVRMGGPATFSATGLPPGLSVDPVTGVISGAVTGITLEAIYTPSITATSPLLSGTVSALRMRVIPVLTSATVLNTVVDPWQTTPTNWELQTELPAAIMALGNPTWSATSLPPGLSINPKTGAVTGMATTPGTYTPTITVTGPDSTVRQQTITMHVRSTLNGVIGTTHGRTTAGWRVMTATVSTSQSISRSRPSFFVNGDPIVRQYLAVNGPVAIPAIASATPSPTGTVTITQPGQAPFNVSVRNITGNVIAANASCWVRAVTTYQDHAPGVFPPLPTDQTHYYVIPSGFSDSEIDPGDTPGVSLLSDYTISEAAYFSAINDWIADWPTPSVPAMLQYTAVVTAGLDDTMKRIWFGDCPNARTNDRTVPIVSPNNIRDEHGWGIYL